ncbi:MAG: Cell division protein FtsX [bacterium ADurb.Bin212]|nr:MAG: Cell division protein FtsX [bacterium ADurb.Bin212]
MFTSVYRVLKTALISLWRNRGLSLVSTLIMVITLIIISIFLSINIVTNKVTKALESKIDMAAYIKDEATDEQITALKKMLSNRADVLEVKLVSKDEALARWQERYRENEKIRDVVSESNNPLPRSLEIKTEQTEDMETIAKLLSDQTYQTIIRELSYTKSRDMINRMTKLTSFIQIVGWSLSAIFILISIMVIYNTIRLTISARSYEIEIMRLVGASDWYVRGPFIIEGVVYGIIATLIASLLIIISFNLSLPHIKDYLGDFDLGGGYMGVQIWYVVLVQLVIGVFLGALCSITAIKKHLNK